MASTIITKNKNTGAPSTLAAGELAINTEIGSLYYGSTGGTSVSSSFTFGAITGSVISASGNVEGGSLRADDLTAGRVAFVGTDGLLVDDSDLTFTTATLTATNLASTIVDTTNLEVSNIRAKDGTAAGSIADSSGIVTLASSVLTTTDINGGTIDGCNITVGSGKILELRNAAAVNMGDISMANLSISDDIVHSGDLNNKITFGTDTQNLQTGGSSRLDISDSGIRLGGTGARVTSITDDDSLGTSDTVLCTQGNVKAYVDANAGGSVSGNTFATDLKVGRDADNLIDFTTDNQVTFRVSAGDGIVMKASGEIEATKFDGDLEGNADTATTATNATHVTVTDNESTNEDNLIPFIEDTSATGNVGLESDGDFHYNPSTGKLTATQLAGTLQTAAQTNITSVGTLSSVTVSGDVNANGNIVGDGATQLSGLTNITAIGNMALGNHATDDHTITGRTEIVGNITASGDISGSGAISTTSTIRGIMPQVISANMGGASLGTSDVYIPLAEGELDGTNHDHVRVNLVAPFSGSLRRIVVRSNAAFGTNEAYTASLYVIHDDEVASGKTLAGHHQIGLDADKHSAHALVFDFANRVTGSNVINGGDRVLISLKSSRTNSQNYYCTTVFAWDYHETTGIVTNSDGVIAGVGGI